MFEYLEGRLSAIQGDITALDCDAVVNAANSSLMGGGGVDGAIHRKAGPTVLEECRRIRKEDYPEGLPPGMAVLTGAGNLPAKKIIHTVGPVWHGGGRGEKETLSQAYRNCLLLAEMSGCRSIAFPAISTGVYGFPKDLAGPIAFRAVREHLEGHTLPETVLFVFFSASDLETFTSSIEGF